MAEWARPTILQLYRHGETNYHGTKKVAGGLTNVPLNQTGREQAVALAERTRGLDFTAVHTSPLLRARDTAKPIARVHGIAEIFVAPELRERSFGTAIEKLTDDSELEGVRAMLVGFWKMPPTDRMDTRLNAGMETDRELLDRVRGHVTGQPRGERIAATTHWDVISTLTLHETGVLIDPANTTGVTLHVVRDKIEVVDFQGNDPILSHAA